MAHTLVSSHAAVPFGYSSVIWPGGVECHRVPKPGLQRRSLTASCLPLDSISDLILLVCAEGHAFLWRASACPVTAGFQSVARGLVYRELLGLFVEGKQWRGRLGRA